MPLDQRSGVGHSSEDAPQLPPPRHFPRSQRREAKIKRLERELVKAEAKALETAGGGAGEDWALFVKAATPFLRELEVQGRANSVTMAPIIVARETTGLKRLIEHWPNLPHELKAKIASAKDGSTLLSRYVTKQEDERTLAEGLTWTADSGGHRADFGAGRYRVAKIPKREGWLARWTIRGDRRGEVIADVRTLEAAKTACEQHARQPE